MQGGCRSPSISWLSHSLGHWETLRISCSHLASNWGKRESDCPHQRLVSGCGIPGSPSRSPVWNLVTWTYLAARKAGECQPLCQGSWFVEHKQLAWELSLLEFVYIMGLIALVCLPTESSPIYNIISLRKWVWSSKQLTYKWTLCTHLIHKLRTACMRHVTHR